MFPPERIICLTEETVETLYHPVENGVGCNWTSCAQIVAG